VSVDMHWALVMAYIGSNANPILASGHRGYFSMAAVPKKFGGALNVYAQSQHRVNAGFGGNPIFHETK